MAIKVRLTFDIEVANAEDTDEEALRLARDAADLLPGADLVGIGRAGIGPGRGSISVEAAGEVEIWHRVERQEGL